METFKQFMAFPLYATVGYLIWVLGRADERRRFSRRALQPRADRDGGVDVWPLERARREPPVRGCGVVGLVVVGAFGSGSAGRTRRECRCGRANGTPAITWEPWSPEAVARLRGEGRIVYVDFTARWCATCQTNKKLVFGSG